MSPRTPHSATPAEQEILRGERRIVINGKAQLAMSVATLLTMLGFAWQAATYKARLDQRLERIEDRLSSGMESRWKAKPHMTTWADQLGRDNPALKIPDPMDVVRRVE